MRARARGCAPPGKGLWLQVLGRGGVFRHRVRGVAPSAWVRLCWQVVCQGIRRRRCRKVHLRGGLWLQGQVLGRIILAECAVSCSLGKGCAALRGCWGV